MRIACEYDTKNANENFGHYRFESQGPPDRVFRELRMQVRMCDAHAKQIEKRIKADEHRERNRA